MDPARNAVEHTASVTMWCAAEGSLAGMITKPSVVGTSVSPSTKIAAMAFTSADHLSGCAVHHLIMHAAPTVRFVAATIAAIMGNVNQHLVVVGP